MGEARLIVSAVSRSHVRNTIFAPPSLAEYRRALTNTEEYGLFAVEHYWIGEEAFSKCLLVNRFRGYAYESTFVKRDSEEGWMPIASTRVDDQHVHLLRSINPLIVVTTDCALLTEAVCNRIQDYISMLGAPFPPRHTGTIADEQRRLLLSEASKVASFELADYVDCDTTTSTYTALNDFFKSEIYKFHLECFDRDTSLNLGFATYDRILRSEIMHCD